MEQNTSARHWLEQMSVAADEAEQRLGLRPLAQTLADEPYTLYRLLLNPSFHQDCSISIVDVGGESIVLCLNAANRHFTAATITPALCSPQEHVQIPSAIAPGADWHDHGTIATNVAAQFRASMAQLNIPEIQSSEEFGLDGIITRCSYRNAQRFEHTALAWSPSQRDGGDYFRFLEAVFNVVWSTFESDDVAAILEDVYCYLYRDAAKVKVQGGSPFCIRVFGDPFAEALLSEADKLPTRAHILVDARNLGLTTINRLTSVLECSDRPAALWIKQSLASHVNEPTPAYALTYVDRNVAEQTLVQGPISTKQHQIQDRQVSETRYPGAHGLGYSRCTVDTRPIAFSSLERMLELQNEIDAISDGLTGKPFACLTTQQRTDLLAIRQRRLQLELEAVIASAIRQAAQFRSPHESADHDNATADLLEAVSKDVFNGAPDYDDAVLLMYVLTSCILEVGEKAPAALDSRLLGPLNERLAAAIVARLRSDHDEGNLKEPFTWEQAARKSKSSICQEHRLRFIQIRRLIETHPLVIQVAQVTGSFLSGTTTDKLEVAGVPDEPVETPPLWRSKR